MRAVLWALVLSVAGCGASGGASCGHDDLIGTWQGYPVQGRFVGMMVAQHFVADGSYSIDLNQASFHGSWGYADGQLTISGDGSCPSGSGDGVYLVKWDGCQDAVLSIVSDPCMGRSQSLNGMHIIRPF
jgi:hypothetical protein